MASTDNSAFARDFLAAANKKGTTKTLGDAIGMPDEQDKAFLTKLINRHEKKFPGQIQALRDWGRTQHQSQYGRTAEWSEVNKAAHGRLMLDLPPLLYQAIEIHYPTLFVERKHFRWFCRNFPHLLIPRKH